MHKVYRSRDIEVSFDLDLSGTALTLDAGWLTH